ncbi:MAG: 2-oxoglutarate dehydrogenase complex dihydrolipoyllysine-residue succinyltransferase [Candidatus Dadabacteria bacterium]|nr:2-oxoglutarate dehydrogenase complex dihydrolipoyllysine-residue succinyltransferase [Candidatus Dadabacteria bacterium]MYA48063.1 2-oxoglutarate dehydrogenase complex dihydrolipoyllysine-residue succinyltransferase [Candidatus Dadabacteria bacterium]MYF47538.1 2-oxoglutarate dehydrogenase complex dihydrolipoyllysine-residue succinyltransferase [Candidatus Dadabacteria bacterium]MYG83478.1 2-oxoglutarate dehydrogenase complex dihydrolipoyllysine-residue succinyltransferase [Candidatus Dadabac
MAKNIVVPHLGDSVIEATIIKWTKRQGDTVKLGETVVELETEKANFEVAAETTGILASIAKKADEDVEVGDILGTIEVSAGKQDIKDDTEEPAKGTEAAPEAPAEEVPQEKQRGEEPQTRVTPVARNIAEQNQVDLSQVVPEGNRITKEDVEKHLESQKTKEEIPQEAPSEEKTPETPVSPELFPSLSQLTANRERRMKMSRRRRTIARRLVEAQQTAAILSTFNEIDMSNVMELRSRKKDDFKERYGVNLGFSSFFIKASIGALKLFPEINAEIQDDEIVYKDYYDIGIAVGAEGGLVVPVIREADRKTFAQIEKEVRELAEKANANTLSLDEIFGGTFTITNGGVYGSLMSTPILNPPQVAILGLHKIEERPVAVNGDIVIKPMMYTALSYDHRIVDGKEAVQFLVRVKELIEDPETLLIEG